MKLGLLEGELPKHVNLEALSRSLVHPSYINEFKSTSLPTIDLQRARAETGKALCKVVTGYVAINDFGVRTSEELTNSINQFSTVSEIFYDRYELHNLVRLGRGERNSANKKYIEIAHSLLYAIYEHCGFWTVLSLLQPLHTRQTVNIDYKTKLQEYVASQKGELKYEVIDESGHPHEKTFQVVVSALGQRTVAEGRSKKRAETEGAKLFLERRGVSVDNVRQNKNAPLTTQTSFKAMPLSRRKLLSSIQKDLGLTDATLPITYLDVCLTHKSAANENKHLVSNDLFKSLGAYVADFTVYKYLSESFDGICRNDFGVMVDLKNSLVSSEVLQQFVSPKWISALLRSKGFDVTSNTTGLLQDLFQSILGALYFFSSQKRTPEVFKSVMGYIPKLAQGYDTVKHFQNHRAMLDNMVQFLGLELGKEEITAFGESHNLTHQFTITVFDPSNAELEDTGEGTDSKVIVARRKASEAVILSWVNLVYEVVVEGKAAISPIRKAFLINLLAYMVDDKIPMEFKNYINAHTFQAWSKVETSCALENLHSLGLLAQAQNLYAQWCELRNGADLADSTSTELQGVLSDPGSAEGNSQTNADESEQRDPPTKMNQTQGNNITIPTHSNKPESSETGNANNVVTRDVSRTNSSRVKTRVNSRLYSFSTDSCDFCGLTFTRQPRVVQATTENRVAYIEVSALSCATCGISGLRQSEMAELQGGGYVVGLYEGSPGFFEATVLRKSLLSSDITVRVNERVASQLTRTEHSTVSRKRKGDTPEELLKKLEVQRQTGFRGEQFVFNREKMYLQKLGRSDLADRVEWVSQEDSGVGYDIKSFSSEGRPRYIEVKSTRTASRMSFEITRNELETAKNLGEQYVIYRVFNVMAQPHIMKISNPTEWINEGNLSLKPSSYVASLSGNMEELEDDTEYNSSLNYVR